MCSYPLETRACLVLVVLCSHTLFPLSRERRPEKTGQSGVACAAAPPLSLGLLALLRHLGRSDVGGSLFRGSVATQHTCGCRCSTVCVLHENVTTLVRVHVFCCDVKSSSFSLFCSNGEAGEVGLVRGGTRCGAATFPIL